LCAGVESIRRFDEAELEDSFDVETRRNPDFVKARSVLDDVAQFDAGFFGMHAREAELTDPQHRILLECCWEALEDAGYDPARFAGSIGLYAGASLSSYFLRNVLGDRGTIERFTSNYQVDDFPLLVGSGQDFLATRIAYKLDLRGPAVTVASACSTSLAAVVQAAQALILGQADMMLAGAVSVTFPQRRGYLHQDGGMVSLDGHCRTFDAKADGTVFGDGAGVVVLKRLADALADNDAIYAVIRGFGINNDGSRKVGFTAPSVEGQVAAITAAHAMASFDAASVEYVECHGTATPLGDPIELTALAKAFRAGGAADATCAIGSVKSNIGHLDVAAGMSGLIKTALAIRNGRIPASLNFESPNPQLNLESTPFFVNTALAEWRAGGTRRAGVSAFGMGGTNVHLALEAPPSRAAASLQPRPELLVVSGRTPAALAAACDRLASHLAASEEPSLANAAFTLQSGRRAFSYRRTVVAASPLEASELLRQFARTESPPRKAADDVAAAFMFPGQGSQYVNMGRGLYDEVPVFRETLDRCAEILSPLIGRDIRGIVYPNTGGAESAATLTATAAAQPAIFSVAYALARTWMSWGLTPQAFIGHSVGEFVAATLAGVFSLEDALAIVAERGRLIQSLRPGAMLAVRLDGNALAELMPASLSVAALNSPTLSVVSGAFEEVTEFERALAAKDVTFRRLETSHAFHSSMMDPILEPLAARLAAVELAPPSQPYVSCVTGTWITDDEATSPAYWAQHCRRPVRFADGISALLGAGIDALVEVGPGATLGTLARQGAAKDGSCEIVASLPGAARERSDREVMLESVGRLWAVGVQPAWREISGDSAAQRVSLPTYPFERSRYWVDAPAAEPASDPAPRSSTPPLVALSTNGSTPASAQPAGAGTATRAHAAIVALLEELSGEPVAPADPRASFLELGFDSLFLGRFVQQLNARFGSSLTFRQLLSDIPSIAALAERIADRFPDAAPAASETALAEPDAGTLEGVVRAQIAAMQNLMREQIDALSKLARNGSVPAPSPAPLTVAPAQPSAVRLDSFGPGSVAINAEITPAQAAHIAALVAETTARTPRSKASTQNSRAILADPRVAAGFRSEWKEMVYPIVSDRAKGSRIWDIDGNEYIDLLNGFGQTAFGHSPDFVVEAVSEQLAKGFAIGPQTALAGEASALFCELTGNERVTFCNTGSEAVMAALRVARTVTGRDRFVTFSGDYHGQFDEVLVKGTSSGRALPVAAGIPAQSVSNAIVLQYGADSSLEWIREHAGELAAVLVEPVQSRHPALQPKEFLAELRSITEAAGAALIFDEVVTGFRTHPGGMQAVFGIRADLATYGKVVGGGLPIGILAGTARFMDALDGGMWQYGDDSVPEVAPTFVAGTFVRHPLVMAAVLAVLRHLKASGPALQERLSATATGLVTRLNRALARRGIASRIEGFASFFYVNFSAEERLAGLLYYHLRNRGVYISEGFPCFLTTAHTQADVDRVVLAFEESLDALQAAGIFPGTALEFPPTEEQTEIWLSAQLSDAASCAFNESVTLRLRGRLDEAAFRNAWDAVVARHEALRGAFSPTGETMRILPDARVSFDTLDVSMPGIDAEVALADLVARDAETPFDLVGGPLVRAKLVRMTAEEAAFVVTAHHIVCDGWSMNVVLEDFAALYAAELGGSLATLQPALAFSAYARAQRERDPRELERVETFWLRQFQTLPAPLALPTDRPRPEEKSFKGATRSTRIAAADYAAIRKAGAREGCTLFVTLLTAFSALMGRLADQEDVVVGVPAAGQSLLDGGALVGHCVDFLPLRAAWGRETSLSELLTSTKRHVLDAYEHQTYTLGTLVRKLSPARASNRVPLAEVQFNLERLGDRLSFPELDVETQPNAKAFVNFDLFFNVVESNDGLRIDCDFNTDLFDDATIDRWLRYYRGMLDAIVGRPAERVSAVAYVPAAERGSSAALTETTRDYPRDASLCALFEAQVAARPDAPAVLCGADTISYAELNRRANQLAHRLREIAPPGARIGVCVERSIDMPLALLATLKAGCAYVPLDPSHPRARLERIFADSGMAVLVTSGDTPFATGSLPVVDLSREAQLPLAQPESALPGVAPETLAYVIYTSGSTGVPKGVEVTHRSVVNLLWSMAHEPGLAAADVFVAVTTVSFDIAALELFLPLVVGAKLVVAPADTCRDGFALAALLASSKATCMQATPATWRMLLEAAFRAPAGFRMLCGGEALPNDLAEALLASDGELWNMYGPTETTIWSSCKRIVRADEPITIGLPIANTTFYVLDRGDQVVAQGQVGELHIGGDGVARGYVNLPELTAEKFIANPFGAGRLYRTGDMARVLANGEVSILGRADQQVKLRGFRIELGEIETAILGTGLVARSAIALRDDAAGNQQLVGYVVEHSGSPVSFEALRAKLARELPDYMLPAAWVKLSELPLTPNAKLDRAALPAPAPAEDPELEFTEPRTPIEAALATIWAEVLRRDRVSRTDDLLALGADSIQVFKITARANRQGIALMAKELMQHRTIARLASHLEVSSSR
jgi:amino acid adenylation domain-containing protein